MFEQVEINSERWLDLTPLKNEIWKDIEGYEGLYQVSNYGRIKSLCRKVNNSNCSTRVIKEIIMKIHTHINGYCFVVLSFKQKQKPQRIHRLVAQAFISNPDNYPQVNHKDENKLNNRVDNLEWCTIKYNVNYGTGPERRGTKIGKPVLQISNDTIINEFKSLHDAARYMKCSVSNIMKCCKGVNKTACGYNWKYKKEYKEE